MKKNILGLTMALCLGLSVEAMATSFTGSATGLSTPGNVITFEEQGNLQGQIITNQFAGASFNSLIWDNATYGQAGGTGFAGGDLTNIGANGSTGIISFGGAVSAAAFAIMDQGSTYTFNAWLNGVNGTLVDSFNAYINYNPGAGFVGFENSIFDTIEIINYGSAFAIDNLQYTESAPVPEPGTIVLFGAGMAGLAIFSKRRKNSKA